MDSSVNALEFRELGEEEKERGSARFYRNDFDKGYQRKLGKFTLSSK